MTIILNCPGNLGAQHPASSCLSATIICSQVNLVFLILKAPFCPLCGAFRIISGRNFGEQVKRTTTFPRFGMVQAQEGDISPADMEAREW
jgi:hypothetical protein